MKHGKFSKGISYNLGCQEQGCERSFRWKPRNDQYGCPRFCLACRNRRFGKGLEALWSKIQADSDKRTLAAK